MCNTTPHDVAHIPFSIRYAFHSLPMYATFPAHLVHLHLITLTCGTKLEPWDCGYSLLTWVKWLGLAQRKQIQLLKCCVLQNTGWWPRSKTPLIPPFIQHRQNPLGSKWEPSLRFLKEAALLNTIKSHVPTDIWHNITANEHQIRWGALSGRTTLYYVKAVHLLHQLHFGH